MTAKTSSVRLYIAVVALLTAVLTLLGAMVRLVASSATWLAARIEARTPAAVRQTGDAGAAHAPAKGPGRPALALVPQTTPNAPEAAQAPAQAVQLTQALIGLGFKTPAVRRFVVGLGERADREPIAGLIKEGLAALGTAVAS